MARKFSLKDNPIFQRLDLPTPRPQKSPENEEDSTRNSHQDDKDKPDSQNLTLKNRLSKFDPQNPLKGNFALEIEKDKKEAETLIPVVHKDEVQLEIKDNIDKSSFFGFYNEISDNLLPTLETAEQVLYSRLFRLSYGFNRNYCTVSQPVLQERTGLSRNTVRTGLQSLLKRGLIVVTDAGNHISTTYRVILPREHPEWTQTDSQNLTLKNSASKLEAQKKTRMKGKIWTSKK